jgi:M-phase inducer tyrosine phosphatase
MYEHPGDVMNRKEDTTDYTPTGLHAVMDVDDVPTHKLPHFTPSNEPESLPRITDETFVSVLNGDFDHMYPAGRMVIDCRFEYEYEGGHIIDAWNFCDKEKMAEKLFDGSISPNTLLIFHCEYSAHRAPLM